MKGDAADIGLERSNVEYWGLKINYDWSIFIWLEGGVGRRIHCEIPFGVRIVFVLRIFAEVPE